METLQSGYTFISPGRGGALKLWSLFLCDFLIAAKVVGR